MGARMIADITWDAPAVYSDAQRRRSLHRLVVARIFRKLRAGGRSRLRQVLRAARPSGHDVDRDEHDSGHDRPAVSQGRRGVARGSRMPRLGSSCRFAESSWMSALAAEQKAQAALPTLSEQRFFSIDAGLGLEVAQRQTQAALKLDEALRAPDAAGMWKLV